MPVANTATSPSLSDFVRLAATHTLLPVTRSVPADLETPVSAFLRVAAHEPDAFLLESVEGGESVGRYTFIGIRPYRTLSARNGQVTDAPSGAAPRTYAGDIFIELKRALDGHTPARLPGLPPFTAGAVGFFSYDVVRQIETLPTLAADELHVPDAFFMFFDEVLAFDHVRKAIHLIVTTGTRTPLDPSATELAYMDANVRLDRLESLLEAALPKPPRPHIPEPLAIASRTAPADFLAAVDTVKEYIRAGDVFQCVLSQRFDCTPAVDAFEVYRSLRIVNPSPYMYFLRFALPSASAEQGTALPPSPNPATPPSEAPPSATPLSAPPLSATPLSATPLSATPPSATPLSAAPPSGLA
ncbi:MAG TPA: chorismate-binding protein, partial [Acidobacteriaceae bacterium]|nr:chorismate-binding protein [Acidobacteriaceae bacterium]